MLRHVLAQFAERLRIERFVAGHRHIVFGRQPRWRSIAVKHASPGGQRGGHVAATHLLPRKAELPLRHLRHFPGVIELLQTGAVRRGFCQPRPPLGRRLQIAALLHPERHQVQRLGIVSIDQQHLLQRLHRQLIMGFFMPVVGLGKKRLQRGIIARGQGIAKCAKRQGARQAERR